MRRGGYTGKRENFHHIWDLQYPKQDKWQTRLCTEGNGIGQCGSGSIPRYQGHLQYTNVRIGGVPRNNFQCTEKASIGYPYILLIRPPTFKLRPTIRIGRTWQSSNWQTALICCWVLHPTWRQVHAWGLSLGHWPVILQDSTTGVRKFQLRPSWSRGEPPRGRYSIIYGNSCPRGHDQAINTTPQILGAGWEDVVHDRAREGGAVMNVPLSQL